MKRIDARAPVRLDLAGGWTDVPPYTHDMGGEVVNVAINIHAHASLEIDAELLSLIYLDDMNQEKLGKKKGLVRNFLNQLFRLLDASKKRAIYLQSRQLIKPIELKIDKEKIKVS